MAKTAKASEKVQDMNVETMQELLDQAAKEKKSPVQMLANLSEELGKKLKVSKFIKYVKEDANIQINKMERELEQTDENLLESFYDIKDLGNSEESRMRWFAKGVALEEAKAKLRETIANWKQFLTYFEPQVA